MSSALEQGTKGLSDEEKMNQERAAIAGSKPIITRDDDQTQMLNKLKKYVLNPLYSARN